MKTVCFHVVVGLPEIVGVYRSEKGQQKAKA